MLNRPVHNGRTLKKRVRRIIMLCIIATVLLFSFIMTFAASQYLCAQGQFVSEYYCSSIATLINTKSFLNQMHVDDLKNMSVPELTDWFENLGGSDGFYKMEMFRPRLHKNIANTLKAQNEINPRMPIFSSYDVLTVTLNFNNNEINLYTNKAEKSVFARPVHKVNDKILNDPSYSVVKSALDWYVQQSEYRLKDKDNNTILTINARTNYGFMFIIAIGLFSMILVTALLAIIAGSLLSKLFTIPVIAPLEYLEQQIKGAASGDIMNAKIVLKKPLKEIESLAGSTNAIIDKMHEYNKLLFAQNEELEAQNEQLAESKKQIEDAQSLLVQTENMASIGQLTAAITHEINTPLGAINSNTQMCSLLLSSLSGSAAVAADNEITLLAAQLTEANDINLMACKRVSEIIRSLKIFSKIDQAEFQEADLNESVRSVVILTSNLWKNKVVIHEDYGQLPKVKCFSGMLNQVFMNIFVNAIQAIEQKGEIFIKTRADEKNAYVSIRDTGMGIKQENLSKIFDNGFTTKGSVLGMGLGLSITRNIINKHNGDIKVTSEPDTGTEFAISIPLTLQSAHQSQLPEEQ